MVLHSEPSFSIYNDSQNQDLQKIDGLSEDVGNYDFTFGKKMEMIGVKEEDEEEEINRLNGGAGAGNIEQLGEYYRKILNEEASNPLFLRNYAQFLQCQGDSSGAEEYYYRATLADPKDGEILTQYAKLVWELHHDRNKASNLFERAVSAASDDSNIQAAYARFLWEIDESEEENDDIAENTATLITTHDSVPEDQQVPVSSPLHLAIGLGLNAPGLGNGLSSDNYVATSFDERGNTDNYYNRMIEENPKDPLYLRNYAEFLYQSKGDLAGALEYYSRAALINPSDWEIVSQYAKLVWQIHHDKDKATTYFERAVQASPENSDLLGAYARFLWEVEEDDDEIPLGTQNQISSFRAMAGDC